MKYTFVHGEKCFVLGSKKILREWWLMYVEAKMRKIFHEILILFQFKKVGQAEMKKMIIFEILEIFEKSWKIFENVNFLIF